MYKKRKRIRISPERNRAHNLAKNELIIRKLIAEMKSAIAIFDITTEYVDIISASNAFMTFDESNTYVVRTNRDQYVSKAISYVSAKLQLVFFNTMKEYDLVYEFARDVREQYVKCQKTYIGNIPGRAVEIVKSATSEYDKVLEARRCIKND